MFSNNRLVSVCVVVCIVEPVIVVCVVVVCVVEPVVCVVGWACSLVVLVAGLCSSLELLSRAVLHAGNC